MSSLSKELIHRINQGDTTHCNAGPSEEGDCIELWFSANVGIVVKPIRCLTPIVADLAEDGNGNI